MKRLYGFLTALSLFSFLLISAISVVPDPASLVFLELCGSPTSWDITFRGDHFPVRDLTPEEVKSDLMKFASVYQPGTEIRMSATAIVALVIFIFSVIGLLRERHFQKSIAADSPEAVSNLQS